MSIFKKLTSSVTMLKIVNQKIQLKCQAARKRAKKQKLLAELLVKRNTSFENFRKLINFLIRKSLDQYDSIKRCLEFEEMNECFDAEGNIFDNEILHELMTKFLDTKKRYQVEIGALLSNRVSLTKDIQKTEQAIKQIKPVLNRMDSDLNNCLHNIDLNSDLSPQNFMVRMGEIIGAKSSKFIIDLFCISDLGPKTTGDKCDSFSIITSDLNYSVEILDLMNKERQTKAFDRLIESLGAKSHFRNFRSWSFQLRLRLPLFFGNALLHNSEVFLYMILVDGRFFLNFASKCFENLGLIPRQFTNFILASKSQQNLTSGEMIPTYNSNCDSQVFAVEKGVQKEFYHSITFQDTFEQCNYSLPLEFMFDNPGKEDLYQTLEVFQSRITCLEKFLDNLM
ncbi:MAG: hypothetical protein MHMPM18_004825, partial [Marteilia pararefringens]